MPEAKAIAGVVRIITMLTTVSSVTVRTVVIMASMLVTWCYLVAKVATVSEIKR
jgi:hypothetical protein